MERMEVNLAVRRIRTALFPYIRMVLMNLIARGLPFEPQMMANGLITHLRFLRFTRPYIHWRLVPEYMDITEEQVITYQFILWIIVNVHLDEDDVDLIDLRLRHPALQQ